MPEPLGLPDVIQHFTKAPLYNQPLAAYTTWNIGGEAEVLLEPESADELVAAYLYAKDAGLPLTILGRGSNTLIDDAGIPGVVVCLRSAFDTVTVDSEQGTVHAEAGCPLPKLAVKAGQGGLSGFEFLTGIPGTVGAGVAINAGVGGAHGISISERLERVRTLELETGSVQTLSANQAGLRYRHSDLLHRHWVLDATFRAEKRDDVSAIKARQKEVLKKRAAKQPLQRHTSGSVFKQPEGGEPAGWYIDQVGLKGYRVGGAVVSPKHANWIENGGDATSQDVKTLMAHIQEVVEKEFGVWLKREVRFLPQDSLTVDGTTDGTTARVDIAPAVKD